MPNENTPVAGSDIDLLLASPNPAERIMALKQPGVSEHHVWRAVQDPNLNVFKAALQHPELRREHIDYVVKNRAREMPDELTQHPLFDNEMLDYMLQRPNDYGLVNTPLLASHPKLTRDQVEKMLAGSYPLGLYATRGVRSQGLTPDDLRSLYERFRRGDIPDPFPSWGASAESAEMYLLDNPNMPGDLLRREAERPQFWTNSTKRRSVGLHLNTPADVIARVTTDDRLTASSLAEFARHPEFSREMHERALDRSFHPLWAEELLNHSRHTSSDDLVRTYLDLPKRDAWQWQAHVGGEIKGGRYDWTYGLMNLSEHPAHTDETRAAILKTSHLDPKVYDRFARAATTTEPEALHAALANPHPGVAEEAMTSLRNKKQLMPEQFFRDFVAARGRPMAAHVSQALAVTDASPELLRDYWSRASELDSSQDPQNRHSPEPFEILHQIAGHPNVPPDVAMQAANHGDHDMRLRAVESGKLDEPTLRNLVINEFHEDVRNAALKAGGPRLALAGLMSQWPQMRHRAIDFYSSYFTPEMWSQALTDHDHFVRANAVSHAPGLLPDQAQAAALDDNQRVRESYAKREDVLPEHFGLLTKDPDHSVRMAAVSNPNLPDDHLRAVANDEKQHPDLRKWATERLSEREPDTVHQERVRVKLGTHKLRAIRDHILGLKLDEVHPKQLPPGDWKAGRTPQGLISAKKIQQYLDALPGTEFNVSHGKWDGAQRHNHEPSKVFRVGLTNDMVRKLRASGVYGSFLNTNRELSQYHEMPISTVGWVRYTGTPKNGIHIDEIQSDFQNALADKLRGEAAAWDGKDENLLQAAYERGSSIQNPQHHPAIRQIIFGNKEPTEWLHEAFLQYLRDRGHHKAEVHMPSSAMTRQKLLDEGHLRQHNGLPAHVVHTYDSMPKKAGYQDAEYGEIPTQSNPKYKRLKDPDTGAVVPAAKTRKTKVMKSEDDGEMDGPEEVVLVPDSDHFANLTRPEIRRKAT